MSFTVRNILGISKQEEGPVYLLLLNSFFIGAFIASYDVASTTLFLDSFGEKYLNIAIVFAGMAGIITTYLYVRLQRVMKFSNLALLNFGFTMVSVILITIGLNVSKIEEIVFASFILLGPTNAILILSFYGTISRTFNLKDEKRITGTADQGQMLATTLAFFAIPFLQDTKTILKVAHTEYFFYGSSLAIIFAFLSMFWFNTKYGYLQIENQKAQVKRIKAGFREMFNSRYVFFLMMLVLASVFAFRFVEYSFLSVALVQYPKVNELSNFLAFFGGTLTIFSFITQTIVGDYVIANYGIRVGLLILPILIFVFTIISSLMGTFFGYTVDSATFILFFIFISMSKLFLSTCKDSFEDPILKNLFLPLESAKRFDIQSKIEGVFKEFSGVLAGITITLLGLIQFVELVHFSYFLVIAILGYSYIAYKLYDEYRKTLTNTLYKQKSKQELEKEYEISEILKKELNDNFPKKSIYTLKLLEKIEPFTWESSLENIIENSQNNIKEYAIKRADEQKCFFLKDVLKSYSSIENNTQIKILAKQAIQNLEIVERTAFDKEKLFALIKSRKIEDREVAAKIIYKVYKPEYKSQMLTLLRDTHPKVRISAIMTASRIKDEDFWPVLIENLSSHTYGNVAASSLYNLGEKIIPTLETAFHKTGQNIQTMLRIVQIYGRINGELAIDLLWNKLEYPDKKIVSQALECLSNCGFRPNLDKKIKIKSFLNSEIGNVAWNIASVVEIDKDVKYSNELVWALEEEIIQNYEIIYMLLALIYEPDSIKLVKKNIESGTVEGEVYAIELLDVFLDDDIKPKFFPLLDAKTQEERNQKLQLFYPRNVLDSKTVLLHIINRDFNSLNRWTKACAMFVYAEMPDVKVTNDLIANLFNPDPLLRESSAWVIHKISPSDYEKSSVRLDYKVKKILDNNLFSYNLGEGITANLMFEEVLFLKEVKYFNKIAGQILTFISETTDEIIFKPNEIVISKGTTHSPIFIIREGVIVAKLGNDIIFTKSKQDLVGEAQILESDVAEYDFIATEETFCYRLDKDRFYELMSNNYRMAKEYVKNITQNMDLIESLTEEAVIN